MRKHKASHLARVLVAVAAMAIATMIATGDFAATADAREVPGVVSVMVLPAVDELSVAEPDHGVVESECSWSRHDLYPPPEDCDWNWHSYLHFGYP